MIPAPGMFCKCPRTHLSFRGTAEGSLGRVSRQSQILLYPLLHPAIFEPVVEPSKFYPSTRKDVSRAGSSRSQILLYPLLHPAIFEIIVLLIDTPIDD